MTVKRNNPVFIFYFLTSFIIKNKKKIYDSDVEKLPETMTSLRIISSKDLDTIWS